MSLFQCCANSCIRRAGGLTAFGRSVHQLWHVVVVGIYGEDSAGAVTGASRGTPTWGADQQDRGCRRQDSVQPHGPHRSELGVDVLGADGAQGCRQAEGPADRPLPLQPEKRRHGQRGRRRLRRFRPATGRRRRAPKNHTSPAGTGTLKNRSPARWVSPANSGPPGANITQAAVTTAGRRASPVTDPSSLDREEPPPPRKPSQVPRVTFAGGVRRRPGRRRSRPAAWRRRRAGRRPWPPPAG